MSEAIDRVLDVLGGKLATVCADGCGAEIVDDYFDEIRPVLERELKPLLLAGQAMRWQFDTKVTGPWTDWDAALASNERPAERGKGNE